MSEEAFRPLPHTATGGIRARLRFAARLVLDLQVRSVHKHMRRFLPPLSGEVLDVDCGRSPYRHLLGPGARYRGIDFEGSSHVEYEAESDVTSIASRLIVFAFRPLLGGKRGPLALLGTVLMAPAALVAAVVGQASLGFHLGSPDDPLGYTVWIRK